MDEPSNVMRVRQLANPTGLMKEYYNSHRTFFVSVIVGSVLAIILYLKYYTHPLWGRILWYALFVPPLLFVGGYLGIGGQKQEAFMRRVAEALGFTYSPEGNVSSLQGALFDLGGDREIFDIFSGKYKELPMCMFNYTRTVGHGKSVSILEYRVGEFTLHRELPCFLIAPIHADTGDFGEEGNSYAKVHIHNGATFDLEGNFRQFFRVETEKGGESKLLEILTPDIMLWLIDEHKSTYIEMSGTRLIISAANSFGGKDSIADFYERSIKIADVIGIKARSIHDN